jgi:3-methyladenine DNA glycosylase AlkD
MKTKPVADGSTSPPARVVLARLRKLGNEKQRQGMTRFGIKIDRALGINVPTLRALAKEIGRDHQRAVVLWESGVHEARHIAIMTADPNRMSLSLMKRWAKDCDSWDLTDDLSCTLLDKSKHAVRAVRAWSHDKDQWVRRAAFALIAGLAVHDKEMPDEVFESFFPLIEAAAGDDRHWVKKAVNWALRQIGKRNKRLMGLALACGERVKAQGTSSARWIAADALRELRAKAAARGWN